MDYEFNFTSIPDYVVITTNGPAIVDDFYLMFNDLVKNQKWVSGTNLIVDHRNLEATELTPKDMDKIKIAAACFAEKLGKGKCAFVMNGTYGLLTAEYYCNATQNIHGPTKVFVNISDAKKWMREDIALP